MLIDMRPDRLRPDMGPPFPADHWVAPGGTDGPACGSFTAPCHTIATALGMCMNGQTVGLVTGTYAGNVSLPAGCNLVGQGRGLVTVMGAGAGAGPDVTVNNGGSVEGMTLTGGVANGTGGPDDGGGVAWNNGNGTIKDVVVRGNSSTDNGGGVRVSNGNVTIEESFIWFNTNTASGGAGIAIANGNVMFVNDVIANNTSSGGPGGGLLIYGGGVGIRFCTFANNAAGTVGGAIAVTGGALTQLDSSILWSDTAASAPSEISGTVPAASFSDIQGIAGAQDPQFRAPSASPSPNYGVISCSSPVAGAGSTVAPPTVDVNEFLRIDSPPTTGAYDCHD
jgi:hypothetical protein